MARSLIPNQFDYAGIYVEGKRSYFNFKKPYKGSFMSGMLVPMGDPISVFPGVKLALKAHAVVRSNTMVAVPLTPIYIDFFSVWVPHRIVWNHFPQFLGENDVSAWTQNTQYTYPSVNGSGISNFLSGLITNTANYQGDVVVGNNLLYTHYGFGSKNGIAYGQAFYNKKISVLAERGYYFIWNQFFRDENYQRPVLFDKGDNGTAGERGYLVRDYFYKANSTLSSLLNLTIGGTNNSFTKALLMPVNKFHDWASSVLPQPQFGNAVEFGMAGMADVAVFNKSTTAASTLVDTSIHWVETGGGSVTLTDFNNHLNSLISGTEIRAGNFTGGNDAQTKLVADLSTATAINVNQLRSSVMYQRYLEALARGGRRVVEYYEVIYGVKNSKAQDDYPEMVSHTRYQLGVNQVVATADSSGSGWSSHLGDTGAYSVSSFRDIPVCEKEFTEFGYLHVLYAIRTPNEYSQALPQHFLRQTLMDEYNPFFDHIGDVDIPNYLVNKDASSTNNWGFQEAWWFERDQVGLTVGALNKDYGSLAYWVIGEKMPSSQVTCTPSWLAFDPGVFDDVFVSAYYTYPQFIMDAVIFGKKAGRMSQHSIPGIVGRI